VVVAEEVLVAEADTAAVDHRTEVVEAEAMAVVATDHHEEAATEVGTAREEAPDIARTRRHAASVFTHKALV
jgi:hypothetical protein